MSMRQTVVLDNLKSPGPRPADPVPVSIYLVAFSPIDVLDDRRMAACEDTRDRLEEMWDVPAVILTEPDEVVGLQIPVLNIHDGMTDEIEPYLPYYVMEFSDGTRSLMMMVDLEDSEPDPMFQ